MICVCIYLCTKLLLNVEMQRAKNNQDTTEEEQGKKTCSMGYQELFLKKQHLVTNSDFNQKQISGELSDFSNVFQLKIFDSHWPHKLNLFSKDLS